MPSATFACPYCGLSDEDIHSVHTHIVEMHYPEFLAAIGATEIGKASLARVAQANAEPSCGEVR